MRKVDIFWDKEENTVIITYLPCEFNYGRYESLSKYLYRLKDDINIFESERHIGSHFLDVRNDGERVILILKADDIISVENTEDYADITFCVCNWQYTLKLSYILNTLSFIIEYKEVYGLFY